MVKNCQSGGGLRRLALGWPDVVRVEQCPLSLSVRHTAQHSTHYTYLRSSSCHLTSAGPYYRGSKRSGALPKVTGVIRNRLWSPHLLRDNACKEVMKVKSTAQFPTSPMGVFSAELGLTGRGGERGKDRPS